MPTAEYSGLQVSILKEIGSIGTAHAATALARMTGRRISVLPTTTHIVPLEDVYQLFASVAELQVGIYSRMNEGITGCVVFFVPKGQSYNLVDLLMDRSEGTTSVLGDMEQSVMREAGSIICAAYVNAIADFARFSIKLSMPKLIFDQQGQVLESILKGIFPPNTMAIVVENEFRVMDRSIDGYFLLVPEENEIERLFATLEATIR